MKTQNVTLLDGYDASTGFSTIALSLKNMIGCSITASFVGGSPVGSLYLEISNDNGDLGPAPATWVKLTAPTDSTTAVSAAGNFVWNVSNQYAKWIRVTYARTSGSSTATVKCNVKGW